MTTVLAPDRLMSRDPQVEAHRAARRRVAQGIVGQGEEGLAQAVGVRRPAAGGRTGIAPWSPFL